MYFYLRLKNGRVKVFKSFLQNERVNVFIFMYGYSFMLSSYFGGVVHHGLFTNNISQNSMNADLFLYRFRF